MAGVADEATTFQQRQQCIDVLCGYLRLPYSMALGENHRTVTTVSGTRTTDGQVTEHRHEFRQNDKQVRQNIIRIIVDHVHDTAIAPWSAHALDFRGAVLENFDDFSDARFFAALRFDGAQFTSGARFDDATFAQGVWFTDTTFTGAASFFGARFDGIADFDRATFGGAVLFGAAAFDSATFCQAVFTGDAWFGESDDTAATTTPATFGGPVEFSGAIFNGNAHFGGVTASMYFGVCRDPRDDTKLLPAAAFANRDASLASPEEHQPWMTTSLTRGPCTTRLD